MTTSIHTKSYYQTYLDSFVDFIVPKGKKVMYVKDDTQGSLQKYDYIVAKDILGHTDDIQTFLLNTQDQLERGGRVLITQYNVYWEPLLRFISYIGLRKPNTEHNWLSMIDLKNFAHLSGFEVVKSGTKMLLPKYIPFLSTFFNAYIANVFPFSKLGMFHYVVLRKCAEKVCPEHPSLSIIVPARNEAGTIETIVRELPTLGSFTEIIFIEGNSKDNTFEEIVRVAKKYSTTKKILYAKQDGKGKGDAVRKGFDMATGDILAIYDADMTVPAGEVVKFYEALKDGRGDFINGSRLVYPLQKDSMRLLNFFGNKFFSFAFSTILGQSLKDTLCGTKVLLKSHYQEIEKNRAFFGDFDPFGDFDLLFGAAKLNLKIIDMPIHYKERVYGETNIQRWSHGWLLLKMTIFGARKIKFI